MDLPAQLEPLAKIAAAFLLALPVGWDREQADRSLGLRTFPLVAVGACAFVLTARIHLGDAEGVSKVVEGVVSGIGFLGAAAVVKRGVNVHGTATAAAIWVTAAVGVAVAFGDWGISLMLSVLAFVTLRFLTPLKEAAANAGTIPSDRPAADDLENPDSD